MTEREEVERWHAVARRHIEAMDAVIGKTDPGKRKLAALRVTSIDWQNLLQHGIGVSAFAELCEVWLAAEGGKDVR